jgi:hypothetical protein
VQELIASTKRLRLRNRPECSGRIPRESAIWGKHKNRKKAAQAASTKFKDSRKGRETLAEDTTEHNRLMTAELDATIEATSVTTRRPKKS